MKTIQEPKREIPVLREVDVAVVGGGAAGICATVAAARNGTNTLLIESSAYLRGPIIDQGALLNSLKEGRIAGAGLDVFDTEPPEDVELLGLENVVVTPHVAGTTHEALRKMAVQAARSSLITDHH